MGPWPPFLRAFPEKGLPLRILPLCPWDVRVSPTTQECLSQGPERIRKHRASVFQSLWESKILTFLAVSQQTQLPGCIYTDQDSVVFPFPDSTEALLAPLTPSPSLYNIPLLSTNRNGAPLAQLSVVTIKYSHHLNKRPLCLSLTKPPLGSREVPSVTISHETSPQQELFKQFSYATSSSSNFRTRCKNKSRKSTPRDPGLAYNDLHVKILQPVCKTNVICKQSCSRFERKEGEALYGLWDFFPWTAR